MDSALASVTQLRPLARSSPSYDTDRPTSAQYEAFERMCAHFSKLFGDPLPKPLLVFDGRLAAPSFFAADRWSARENGRRRVSEIALNPDVLGTLRQQGVAATLVHELTHLWQHIFGKRKSRAGYHNVEWSEKMESIGLVPSDTGKRGGVRVGQTMSQYVGRGGAFEAAFAAMPREWLLPFLCGVGKGPKRKHDASKSKFVCPCGDAAWGKPSLEFRCLKCRKRFRLEQPDEGDST